MSTELLDVAIVGAGPGGLALALGLKRQGFRVAVFEKSRARSDYVQGFRLRIRARGLEVLERHLPPPLWQAFLDTLGRAPGETMWIDERFRELPAPPVAAEDTHLEKSVSRITLRQVLLAGLREEAESPEPMVRFGAEFTRYEEDDSGVTLHFADGGTVRAALLVGADGARSRVRAQRLPGAGLIDTGVRRLAGKLVLAEARAAGLPAVLLEKNVHVRPARSPGLMITSHRVNAEAHRRHGMLGANDPEHAGTRGLHFDNLASYVWWNIAWPRDVLAPDAQLERATGAELRDLVAGWVADWHPDLQRLIRLSAPETIAALPVRSSVPVPEWAASRVTLLGDAIHSMTYFRALGANSALHDAGLLAAELARHRQEGKPLLRAVADYETALRAHGFEAVETSLSAMRAHVLGERVKAA